jgi:alpha-2-macroglobulin
MRRIHVPASASDSDSEGPGRDLAKNIAVGSLARGPVGRGSRACGGAVLLALASLIWTGCTDPPSTDPAVDGESEAVESVAPSDPARLVARMSATGPADEVPAEIGIRLRDSVFSRDQTGGPAPEGTVLELTPSIAGELRVQKKNNLVFVPADGFLPGTKYTAKLVSVDAGDGPLPTPADGWSTTFETPEFGFVRMGIARRDLTAAVLEVDLVFSAPVDPAAVNQLARFELDGDPVRPAHVAAGPRASVVRARFQGRRFTTDASLQLSLGAGVSYLSDAAVKASSASSEVSLRTGPPVEIEALVVKEGASGHYLDVVCTDKAAGGERWWWDPDTYDGWWVSSRCLADASQLGAIHISPAVDFTLAEGPAGFRLFGDFAQGDYEVTLDAGLMTVDGGMIPKSWEGQVRVPRRTPRVSFSTKGRYLPRAAWRSLAVSHLNTDDAELVVRHIPEQNLVFWIAGEEEAASARSSNIVLRKEIDLSGLEDVEKTSWVDVGGLLPDAGRGVYEVAIESGDARDAARLLLTDMQLIAKRAVPQAGDDGVAVGEQFVAWAVGAHDNAPLSGVEIKLVRPSGFAVDRCRTSSDGSCRLDVPVDGPDETPPIALIATRGDDLTYLAFDELQLQADADVSGLPWVQDSEGAAYRAAAWTDRGVYRPGDTAHVAALLRGDGFTAPEAGLPVVARLYDPRGKELRKKVLATDATGMVTADLPFADFATTGRYRVELEVAERSVGEVDFNVEEFVPERLKVEVAVVGTHHRTTDPVPVDVTARWLFGGSAVGSPIESRCRLEPASFVPEKNAAWHYGLAALDDRRVRGLDLGEVTGVVDEDGKARVTCPASATGGGWMGPAALVAEVAVFEGESGRSTKAKARAPVHPEAYYVGARANVDALANGETAKVDGVIVDHDGEIDTGAVDTVEVVIERLDAEYGWWWDDEDESSSYRRLLRRARMESREVAVVNGKFSLDFAATSDAEGWLLSFASGDARTELRLDGAGRRYYWSPRDRSVDQTPRPARPTPLAITAPADIEVGTDATVSMVAPYAGRVLLSVEADRVLHWEWRDVKAGPMEWTVRVDDFHPNVYVSALLLKDPHLESAEAYLPDRAHGVTSVRVRPTAWTQQVKLTVPDEIRPYSTLEVGLQVDPADGPVTATIAVVDEGILQLTRFASPDPASQVFARRQLGVTSYETIGWSLLLEPRGPSSETGGGAGGAGGRIQMVKPVALWSGPVEVGPDGRATVKFDVPGYRGQLRVMAVTSGKSRMGHAEADITVRDPIVLQTTLPRFLVAGDIAQIPVFVSNMSGAARRVKVSLAIEDIETIAPLAGDDAPRRPIADTIGEKTGFLQLDEGASGTVVFQVTANRAPAGARFRVLAEADGLVSKEELELPVVPANPEDRRTSRVAFTGRTLDLDKMLARQGWMPGSDRTTFWVTANPYSDALSHLQHLVRYPFGCIEQTTSSTRPLLFARDLLQYIDPQTAGSADIDDMVAKGVERVLSMQTPQGGFAYWPGSSRPTSWGTAYATHMLLDAKDAGFPIPADALDDALSYLEREVTGRDDTDPDGTLAYSHFVLARSGRGQPARAERLVQRYEEKPDLWRKRGSHREARTLLMAAMHIGGDRRYEATLRDLDTRPLTVERHNSWSFYSDLRRRSMVLSVYQDVFGVDEKGAKLASIVAEGLRRQKAGHYTTQELAWGISALGRRVQASGAALPEATLKVAGRSIDTAKAGPTGDRSWGVQGATAVPELSMELSEEPPQGAYLVTTVEGVRAADDLPTGGKGLALTREFLLADGSPMDPKRHHLGDRVYVRTTLKNTTKDEVQNLALVDRIPAGWELENSRLSGGELPDWVDERTLWRADHMNLRDDRLEVFGELPRGASRSVVYVVRAVTAGNFIAPEVKAEAMYDPAVWAREPGRAVDIIGPWADFLL